jgi:hypothetical protein
MTAPRSHLFSAAILALGGALTGITALALVVAKGVIATGIPGISVKPQDAALLDDLVAVLPFIVTFAGLNLAAAIGLLVGRGWAVATAGWVATVAVAVGLLAIVLVIAGNGGAADPDGLSIVSVFVSLYAAAALAPQVGATVPAVSFRPVPSAA